jgi:hypothetical protein
MNELADLLRLLEGKMEDVRSMINAYEEGMDYATHCTLQGFAEGLLFALEEVKSRLPPGRPRRPLDDKG